MNKNSYIQAIDELDDMVIKGSITNDQYFKRMDELNKEFNQSKGK